MVGERQAIWTELTWGVLLGEERKGAQSGLLGREREKGEMQREKEEGEEEEEVDRVLHFKETGYCLPCTQAGMMQG